MKTSTVLFWILLNLLNSYNGQNTTLQSSNFLENKKTTFVISEIVSELDKSIWIVFQDRNNNYWFGSDGQGVFNYDIHYNDSTKNSKKFFHYTTKDGLLSNRIRGIQEDQFGNIFITSLEGINKFDGEKFTLLPMVEGAEWKMDPHDLWFSIPGKTGEYGPYRYDGKSLYHLKFPKHAMEDNFNWSNFNHPWSPYEVYTIYKDKKARLWFGTASLGICRYDGKSFDWMYEKELSETPEGGSFGIRSIIEDKDGKFWICNTSQRYNILLNSTSKKGSYFINYQKEKGIENLKTIDGKKMLYFMSAVKDKQGNLWMATYNEGVWKYDGKSIIHYLVKNDDKNVTVFSIYKDRSGDLWLGTHEEAVYKFNGKTFEKWQ
ncbi:MAG: two-component regulator propeller domain-containing protein [Saprospiraceae bacterium]